MVSYSAWLDLFFCVSGLEKVPRHIISGISGKFSDTK